MPRSAKGSIEIGLAWWVGVLLTDPVGLVVADLLPMPKPPPTTHHRHDAKLNQISKEKATVRFIKCIAARNKTKQLVHKLHTLMPFTLS